MSATGNPLRGNKATRFCPEGQGGPLGRWGGHTCGRPTCEHPLLPTPYLMQCPALRARACTMPGCCCSSCCSVYIAFLRQRAVPEAASAARARTSFRRSSVDGGGTGREKAPKIEEGTEAAPLPKWSSATLVSLLVPPATVSRAPATSWAGCEWGVHGHRRRVGGSRRSPRGPLELFQG